VLELLSKNRQSSDFFGNSEIAKPDEAGQSYVENFARKI
jgi:hypothetical protein